MEEYIERNALLREIEKLKKSPWYNDDYGFGTKQARQEGISIVEDLCIKQAPSVDVEEVIHAKWVWRNLYGDDNYQTFCCSECLSSRGARGWMNYCPDCGAKMDLDNSESE